MLLYSIAHVHMCWKIYRFSKLHRSVDLYSIVICICIDMLENFESVKPICFRLMGLASGPQLPPLDMKSVKLAIII